MSRLHRSTAPVAASFLCALASLTATAAFAAPSTDPARVNVDGSYHSVANGINNYDGFDQFRDANGQPLPGWEQELRSPG